MQKLKNCDYEIEIIRIYEEPIAIIIDLNLGRRSVTNSIEELCNLHDVLNIIYRDSERNWDFYNIFHGFKSLAEENTPCRDKITAISLTKEKYSVIIET